MTNSIGKRLMRQLVRVGLPLAAVLLLAPAVRAGCGDGLSSLTEPHAAAMRQPGPPNATSVPAPALPKPCSGPHCSQHRQPLTPVPAPAPTPTGQEWACFVTLLLDGADGPPARWGDALAPQPVRRGNAIFHPPRS